METLYEKLPITFRVNPILNNYEQLVELFSSEDFVEEWKVTHQEEIEKTIQEQKDGEKEGEKSQGKTEERLTAEELKALRMRLIDFYPGKILYELPVARSLFRKEPALKSIHRFVGKCNDAGLLTR